jgi:hypothetical protein
MTPRIRKAAAVATSVAVLGAAGIGVANAADTTSSGTSKSTTNAGRDHRGPGPGARADELAKVAKTLGVTTEKLQAAEDAARPAKGDRPDKGSDGRAAEIAAALGVDTAKVQSILDANRPTPPKDGDRPAAPKAGEQPPAPKNGEQPPAPKNGERPKGPGRGGPGGPGGPRPDDTKLISALATGLGIDEAKVKSALADIAAAHEKEHAAKDAERYAAIAKTLGLDAKDVQAAYEAARPAKPTT